MTIQFDATVRAGAIFPKQPLALPDGTEVHVVVAPLEAPAATLAAGDGIKRAAGTWDDDPNGLDAYLKLTRQLRKAERRSIDP